MQANPPVTDPEPELEVSARRNSQRLFVSGGFLAVAVVMLAFLPWLGRPFSVLSDAGYQALSAHQYSIHFTPNFYSIRTVDPRDLAKDSISRIDAWAPSWVAFFQAAFKLGFSAGDAGRLLAFLFSIIGALGWVRVAAVLGLKGNWKIAGIVIAALYCLRTGSVTSIGQNDLLVYAVAPWLFATGAALSIPFADRPRGRLIARSVLFCLALGLVYWLKYNAIFLSAAILLALLAEQFRSVIRKRLIWSFAVMALYGAAFVTPAIALKVFNYSRSGTDFIEASTGHSPPRTPARMIRFIEETTFYAAPVLFSAGPGAARIGGNSYSTLAWIARLPGLLLLFLILYLMLRRSSSWWRNMTVLCLAVPLLAFPLLSFATGPRFTFAIPRSCEAYWIFLELVIIKLVSERPRKDENGRFPVSWTVLAAAAGAQFLLFLWIPRLAISDFQSILRMHSWTYQTTSTHLYQADLSIWGAREPVEAIKAQIQSPQDVIVLAIYSEHGYGTDIMQEFDNRMLPVTSYGRFRIHSVPASEYDENTPFRSSKPVRVILVTTRPDLREDFEESTERIKRRFPQVHTWTPGPADTHHTWWIWTGETE